MAPDGTFDEEPTYDSPSAFFEAMDYAASPDNNNHNNHNNSSSSRSSSMLDHFDPRNQLNNPFKPHWSAAGSIDPTLTGRLGGFNFDSQFWAQEPAPVAPSISPVDSARSCDTGYVSQEFTPDKSPVDMSLPYAHSIDNTKPRTVTSRPRKRSSKAVAAAGGNATVRDLEAQAPTRKARRTSKATSDGAATEAFEDMDDERRQQFLARNREAASKCRQKKKEWTSSLEQRARELASEKQMLTTYLAMLKNELLMLKCKCLEHSDCGCDGIRDYLKNTVTNLPPAKRALYERLDDGSARQLDDEVARKRSTFDMDSALSPPNMTSPSETGSHAQYDVGFPTMQSHLRVAPEV